TRPSPVSIAETQQLLDDHTVLLALSVGPSTSWGWAITHDAVRSFPLPDRKKIEEQAQRVYADLTARQRHEGDVADMDKRLAISAAGLGDLIFAPIADALRHDWRTHRLAIIATGPLEYIPFSALPEPAAEATTSTASRTLLVEQHEIVRLPSASVLALLRREEA